MVNIGLVELDDCGDCVGGNASCSGCQEETDCNYDADAILAAYCTFSEENYDCNGELLLSVVDHISDQFIIDNIYPNAFNPSINIEYANDAMEDISIKIYNLKGEYIETLLNSHVSVGQHKVSWNGANHSTGIYFVRLSTGNTITTQKIILLK